MMSVTEPVRRFEVFTGAGQRRTWSAADKARIVSESYSGMESVCSVAHRHGLAATRYDKLAENYLAGVKLASARIWMRAS